MKKSFLKEILHRRVPQIIGSYLIASISLIGALDWIVSRYEFSETYVNIAIFTNLTIDHLDFHNTLEEYFDTKLELFKKLNKNSLALLNRDDFYFKKIIPELKCNYETYGFNKKSNIYVLSYTLNINYTKINFKYKDNEYNL